MALIELKITADDPRQLAVVLAALAAVHQLTLQQPAPVARPTDGEMKSVGTPGSAWTGGEAPETERTANVPEAYGEPEAAPEPVVKPARRKRRTKAEIEADKAAAAGGGTAAKGDQESDPPEAKGPDKSDVAKAMEMLLDAGEDGGLKMIGVLMELGAKNDAGEAKLSSLAEEKYAEAIEKMNTLAAEIKAGAGDAAKVLE